MKNSLYIGCSSFNNGYWKKIFYPDQLPRSQWFSYYCSVFDTYELNGTFYKFPTIKTLQNWYLKTPDTFLFSVKAPKQITHILRFNDCADLIHQFYSVCKEGLHEKLGCVLFQLPPSYHYTPEKLANIITLLDTEVSNVMEFRHESWWIPEVWETLSRNNITFCSVSHPLLPEKVFVEAPLIYIRLHGNTKMFYSNYSDDYLNTLKESISQIRDKPIYIYFNNTAGISGILNAVYLLKICR